MRTTSHANAKSAASTATRTVPAGRELKPQEIDAVSGGDLLNRMIDTALAAQTAAVLNSLYHYADNHRT